MSENVVYIPCFFFSNVANSCTSEKEGQIKTGLDMRVWSSYCSRTTQSLSSTRREEPRHYEMERKVWAEKRMKRANRSREQTGSQMWHYTNNRSGGGKRVQTSHLGQSCLPAVWFTCLLKGNIFLGACRRRDRFIGPTRGRPESGLIIRQGPINHFSSCFGRSDSPQACGWVRIDMNMSWKIIIAMDSSENC